MNERTLYLHIGCGKTGSSALQLWLHAIRRDLEAAGYYYPVAEEMELPEYRITSGNGSLLIDALEAGEGRQVLEGWFRNSDRVILSSEHFQGVDGTRLEFLAKLANDLQVTIVIIAYVRDLYDVVYSLYLQKVKREDFSETFPDFVDHLSIVHQFHVVRRYERFFPRENLRILHYDTERERGLDRAFCRAIGLDPERLPPMAPRRVNRSLTLFELELLRRLNRLCRQKVPGAEPGYSRFFSDALIYADPEKETEIYWDPKLAAILRERFAPELRRINRLYLGRKTLRVFRKKGKRISGEIPTVRDEILLLMGLLIEQNPCARAPSGSATFTALTRRILGTIR